MKVTIEALKRGFLVTGPSDTPNDPDWDDAHDMYAELDARAALHRAAAFLGVEPAELYPMPAPELTPAQEALIEYAEAADSATDTLTHGEAYKPEAMS